MDQAVVKNELAENIEDTDSAFDVQKNPGEPKS